MWCNQNDVNVKEKTCPVCRPICLWMCSGREDVIMMISFPGFEYQMPRLSRCHVSRYIHGHIRGISVWLRTLRPQYSWPGSRVASTKKIASETKTSCFKCVMLIMKVPFLQIFFRLNSRLRSKIYPLSLHAVWLVAVHTFSILNLCNSTRHW